MILLSIIVPVYNVEQYVERCIDSILQISNDEIEIILVDDGSTDSSGEICDKYACSYSNIIVIHKENGGLSDARNIGLGKATGKYIWFVDSDDSINFDISRFKECIRKTPDIVCANYTIYESASVSVKNQACLNESVIYSGKQVLEILLENNQYYVAAWKNIFYTRFLKSNNFEFQKGIYHEDEQLAPYLFLRAEKVVYFPMSIYNYYIRNNSISNTTKWEKNIVDIFNVFYNNATYFEKYVEQDHLKRLLLNDIVNKMVYHLNHYNVPFESAAQYIDTKFMKKHTLGLKNKLRVQVYLCFPNVYHWIFEKNEKRKKQL